MKFHRTKMKKEIVLQRLRERGCRITKQRQMLLDVILQEECSSCKEIYYRASSIDSSIGTATVYRMINLLEEIGAISRKNMYKISCAMSCEKEDVCIIELDDHTVCQLSAQNWYKAPEPASLQSGGFLGEDKYLFICCIVVSRRGGSTLSKEGDPLIISIIAQKIRPYSF